jgi:excisionase family DNA binding protein
MTNTTTTTTKASFTIKEAAIELGLSTVYIRRMIQNGKIATVKTQVGDTEVWRHEIAAAELAKWRKDAGSRTTRTDGRNKYALYATAEELAEINEWLAENENGAIVERANRPEDVKKRYAAQKARKAAKKAAAKLQIEAK